MSYSCGNKNVQIKNISTCKDLRFQGFKKNCFPVCFASRPAQPGHAPLVGVAPGHPPGVNGAAPGVNMVTRGPVRPVPVRVTGPVRVALPTSMQGPPVPSHARPLSAASAGGAGGVNAGGVSALGAVSGVSVMPGVRVQQRPLQNSGLTIIRAPAPHPAVPANTQNTLPAGAQLGPSVPDDDRWKEGCF